MIEMGVLDSLVYIVRQGVGKRCCVVAETGILTHFLS